MKKYITSVLICLAACIVVTKPVVAQTGAEAAAVQVFSCEKDLGAGTNLLASKRYDKGELIGVDLLFRSTNPDKLVLAFEHIRLYDASSNEKLLTSSVDVTSGTQGVLVRYRTATYRDLRIAVVLMEGAVKLGPKDVGAGSNIGLLGFSKTDATVRVDHVPPCPSGLANWVPRAPRITRLLSQDTPPRYELLRIIGGLGVPVFADRTAALEAAIETWGEADIVDPYELFLASYWFNSAGSPKLAFEAFSKAMLRIRVPFQSRLDIVILHALQEVGPDFANYGAVHLPEFIQILQSTLEWDAATFPRWAAAMNIDPKAERVQRSRETARQELQTLIDNLKKNPEKRVLQIGNYTFPIKWN